MSTFNVGSVVAKIDADIRNFTASMGSVRNQMGQLQNQTTQVGNAALTTNQRLQILSSGLRSVGSAMTKFVTIPLVGMGMGFIKAASDAEEMQNKFKTVFKDLSDEAKKWSDDTSDAIGRSKYEVMGYMGEMQNLLVGMGATREKAYTISKDIIGMGYDLASFNNLKDKDTIDLMTSALMGSSMAGKSLGADISIEGGQLERAMKELGIGGQQMGVNTKEIEKLRVKMMELQELSKKAGDNFDMKAKIQTNIDMIKEQIKQVEKAGQGTKFDDLDMLTKIQVRFKAIQLQSEDAIGDAERTSASFANSLKALKGAINELAVAFGNELLPTATKVVHSLKQMVDYFTNLPKGVKTTMVVIGSLLAALGPLLLITASFINAFLTIKTAIAAATTAQWAFNAAALANPVGLIIAGVVALVAVIGIVIHKTIGFKKAWEGIKEFFTTTLPKAILSFVDIVTLPLRMFIDLLTMPMRMTAQLLGFDIPFATSFKFSEMAGRTGGNSNTTVNVNAPSIDRSNADIIGQKINRQVSNQAMSYVY